MAHAPQKIDVRYDRQKRLWGESGQKALGTANICVLGASAAGCEAMKNLVLAGIGSFVVVDGAKVTKTDAGCNFFTPFSAVGMPRAETAARTLSELNPNTKGGYLNEAPADVLARDANYCDNFTVVIATMDLKSLRPLAKRLHDLHIPLVHVMCVGQIGKLRLQLPQQTIVETFPDWPKVDLRLDRPFPALRELLDGHENPFQISESDQYDTVPWPILVHWAVKEWRAAKSPAAGEDAFPTFAERKALSKELAKREQPKSQNYREAQLNITNNSVSPVLGANLRELFSRPEPETPHTPFWALVRAVRDFYDRYKVLPVSPKIPDMHSNPPAYLALKKVYTEKARQDADEVHAIASALVPDVTLAMARTFCENCQYVRAVEYRTLEQELEACPTANLTGAELDPWYVACRAVEDFRARHGRLPGECDDAVATDDIAALTELTGGKCDAKYLKEFVRWGAVELSTVATVIGGVVTQEVTKILTRQRVPVNNTFLFDGISNSSLTFVA
eukprot:PhM_4_TR3337/c0_g1_i1/m.84113/K04532/NAE1, APPBP1; amyloid beta precursor protein binding protein 1